MDTKFILHVTPKSFASIVTKCGLILTLAGCEDPLIRSISQTENFVQGEHQKRTEELKLGQTQERFVQGAHLVRQHGFRSGIKTETVVQSDETRRTNDFNASTTQQTITQADDTQRAEVANSGLTTESFRQVSNIPHSDSAQFNDTDARSQQLTVTGQTSEKTFRQTITPRTAGFTQVSTFGFQTTNTFQQVNVPMRNNIVDILIVIDNSFSMSPLQSRLANHFNTFLDHIDGLDWKIAVTTTDISEYGTVREVIRKNQYGASEQQNRFLAAIQAGDNGPNTPRGIANTIGVLLRNPRNFIRNNADFVVIYLTDEDNCKYGYDATFRPWSGNRSTDNPPTFCTQAFDFPQSVVDVATQVKGHRNRVRFTAIDWVPGQIPPSPYNGDAPSVMYNELVFNRGEPQGLEYPIWTPDYSVILGPLGDSFQDPRLTRWTLTHTPNTTGLQVTINGVVESSSHYSIQGQDIVFDPNFRPASGSTIVVSYTVGETPISTLTLTHPAIPSSIVVRQNGTVLPATSYSYNATNRRITFNPVPPQSSVIAVNYDQAPAPQTSYALDDLPAQNSVQVRIDGSLVNPSAYTIASSNVVLQTAPGPYAVVTIQYVKQSDLGRTLVLTETPVSGVAVTLNGAPFTRYTFQNLTVRLEAGVISVGQVYVINYTVRTRDTRQFDLSFPVIASSLQVTVNGASVTNFTLSGQRVTFTSQLPAVSQIIFNYSEAGVLMSSFAVQRAVNNEIIDVQQNGTSLPSSAWSLDAARQVMSFNPTPAADALMTVRYRSRVSVSAPIRTGTLRVSINGVLTTDYTLSGQIITFQNHVPANATMSLSYIEERALPHVFQLATRQGNEIFDVSINGGIVPSTNYSFDLATRALTFNTPPAARAQILVRTRTQVSASHSIKANSLSILVNGAMVAQSHYVRNDRTITFLYALPNNATVQLNYYEDIVLPHVFALASSQDEAIFDVTVAGVVAAPDTYQLNAETRQLNFTTSPIANAGIVVRYKTRIRTPEPMMPGTTQVKINGAIVPSSHYVMESQSISFLNFIPSNTDFVVDYLKDEPLPSQFILSHANAQAIHSIVVGGNVVEMGTFKYDEVSHVLGFDFTPGPLAEVVVSYATQFVLMHKPSDGTLNVTVNGDLVDPSSYVTTDKTILFSSVLPSDAEIKFNYIEEESLPNEFFLTNPKVTSVSRVWLDETALGADQWKFDSAKRSVVFGFVPRAGTKIAIMYQ